ncbi:MAG: adenylate/guanylate cyclase domain-containing protein [Gloeotrichia echinulata CP02]|jgi:adenylate cyclase|nr:PAS domain S-box protein [Gloeotrichia echinulata DEX184]
MKHQLLERIFNKPSFPRKFERLELDEHFRIVDISEQVQRFADRPEEVMLLKDIRLSFPEFIGLEDILKSILSGEQELFQLESIGRGAEYESDIYMDIYILGEQREITSQSRLIILIEDVSERMALQQKLVQRSNEANLLSSTLMAYKNYMDQVISSMADALVVTNNDGKIKKINYAAQKLFGFSEAELIDQPISLIIDGHEFLQKAISQHCLYKQYCQNIEIVCRTKRKEKLLIAFSCSVIDKKIAGLEDIVYIGRDITARQRREQRICAQYAITQILSESQTIKQAMPKILQAICQTLGWDLGELWTPSQYITTSVHRDSTNVVLRCVEMWSSRAVSIREFKGVTWQTTYNSGVGLPGRIWNRRSPLWIRDIADGQDLHRSQSAAAVGLHTAFGFPILDDNEILGVMVFLSQDVQPKDVDIIQMMVSIGNQIAHFIKRKQAEAALVESEERYRDLFENANDLIQSINCYGRFLYVNNAWVKTLGYTEAEIANMNVFDIIHPDFREPCREQLYRVMSGEKLEQVQTAFITKDGQTIFLEGNINCKIVEGIPTGTRGIFRNITQRLAVEAALRHQQEQTERLLRNMLPEAISNRLKQQPGSITEDFADVTVLFADIVGFTEIAASMSAIQLVNLLNPIFSAFDRLSEQYGLEKIKTIGDAYMVVGGLPSQRPDHPQAIAHMALDMQTAIAIFNAENQQNFNIRIGIHSGPVVAGVIGLKKFTYDLWGDTVNIAERMQSHGCNGRIQVSEDTYHRLSDEFCLEKRGEIEVKGKGTMTTYFLIARK